MNSVDVWLKHVCVLSSLRSFERNSHSLNVSWLCYLFSHPLSYSSLLCIYAALLSFPNWPAHCSLSQVVEVSRYSAVAFCSGASFLSEACSAPPGLERSSDIYSCQNLSQYAGRPPAPAPEPGAAGTEVPLFSANWPLWPNGWAPLRAPDVCNEY